MKKTIKKTPPFYQCAETKRIDDYNGWFYFNEQCERKNAVDEGEVFEVKRLQNPNLINCTCQDVGDQEYKEKYGCILCSWVRV